ncbi:MAG: hypothetical protein DSO02_06445, partial [Hadesarchaea archaeon]
MFTPLQVEELPEGLGEGCLLRPVPLSEGVVLHQLNQLPEPPSGQWRTGPERLASSLRENSSSPDVRRTLSSETFPELPRIFSSIFIKGGLEFEDGSSRHPSSPVRDRFGDHGGSGSERRLEKANKGLHESIDWLQRWGGGRRKRMNPTVELLESVKQLVYRVGAKNLMVITSRSDLTLLEDGDFKPLVVTMGETANPTLLHLTFLPREREKRIVHAVSCALSQGKLSEGDLLVCLVEGEKGFLDSLFLYRVKGGETILARLETDPVLKATVDLCRELAHPGGQNPIGAAFVVGD